MLDFLICKRFMFDKRLACSMKVFKQKLNGTTPSQKTMNGYCYCVC